MSNNVGRMDGAFRILVGTAVIGLGVYYGSWWGALGLAPLMTGILRWCPLYPDNGASTRVEKAGRGRTGPGGPAQPRPV